MKIDWFWVLVGYVAADLTKPLVLWAWDAFGDWRFRRAVRRMAEAAPPSVASIEIERHRHG